ncbi:ABC transporter substrate-binding protein [Coraliomargarita sinensis]|uniref:ABC transporter substrate-binding protein n=1 Tax=Coraliomargarita sinensis TaxID=2174842 RepID=A0A317ZP34_9BACT|nr:transporter substrate-binding domain-containing protein [Coraliomargarita sinensis]PXA05111.1 ABC transporter substrate-binding protein [Coraliomargarita sinensis]
MAYRYYLTFFLLLQSFFLASLSGQDASATIKVGLRETAPFAMKDTAGNWSGIAVDLWNAVAARNNYSFEYETYRLADLLKALEAGEVDVAVAPLTITAEREKVFDFTMPFMQSGLAIATEVKPSGWWQTVRRFVSLPFLQAAGALACVIAIFGVLMWFFERKKNEMFGGTTAEGIGSGFWWSAVTMTTVGYGDKAPVTPAGRFVGLVWMFAAIIIISGFTAAIASSLTVSNLESRIESLEDLRGERVGVLESSSAARFLKDERIRYRSYPTLNEMMDELEAGDLVAVVHDRPILRYELEQRDAGDLSVLPELLEPQAYAFGLQAGSRLRESVNRALLEVTQADAWRDGLATYFGQP